MKTNTANGTTIQTALRPATLDAIPERVRQIAMLRGLGYSYRQIASPLQVTPQAVSLMLMRHRRSLKSLRDAMELNSLSARAEKVGCPRLGGTIRHKGWPTLGKTCPLEFSRSKPANPGFMWVHRAFA
jgi:hypothetical protein